MRLLIVEPEASGHRMALYTRLLVREAISKNWQVQILTTRRAISHPAFQLVSHEFNDQPNIFLMEEVAQTRKVDSFSLIKQQLGYYNAIKKGFSQIQSELLPDLVYVINLDYFDKVLGLLGSPFGHVPFSGMLMTINFHHRAMKVGTSSRNDKLYKFLFDRMLQISYLKTVPIIDHNVLKYVHQFWRDEYRKLRFIPDVGELTGQESRESSRIKLNIPQKSFLILVYGSLTIRKNIQKLLEAVSLIPDIEICILLAGIQSEDIQNLMSTPLAQNLISENRLFQSEGFHDDLREYLVFKAADAVWLGYEKRFQGSSGVMIQAASIGCPVLSSSYGLIGQLTEQYDLGIKFDPDDISQISASVIKIFSDSSLRKKIQKNSFSFAEKHSSLNFQKSLTKIISESI